jgi:hypothetical protein
MATARKDDPCSQDYTFGQHGCPWSNVLKVLSKSVNRKIAPLLVKYRLLVCYHEDLFLLAIMRLAICICVRMCVYVCMYACNGGSRCTKGRRSQRRSRMCTLQQMQGKELLQAFCRLAIEHSRCSSLCMSTIANQVAMMPLQLRRIARRYLGDNRSLVPYFLNPLTF